MKKIQDLLFDLEKKVESSLAELSKLKNEKNDLIDKNQILINEKNELNAEFRLLDERFKALKIANTISVPAAATLSFLENPIYLDETDLLYFTASAANDLSYFVSYELLDDA